MNHPILKKLISEISPLQAPNTLEHFSKKSIQIQKSYWSLEEGFKKINEELEKSNQHLYSKMKELNIANDYLNNILNKISQGIMFININGTITIYNNKAEKFLDVKKEKALFAQFNDHFPDDLFGFSIQETINNRIEPNQIFCSLQGDSDNKELLITSSFVSKGDHANQGLFLFISNVTKTKKLKEQVDHNARMQELGQLTTSIAHEIRNPLGGIEGFAALLQQDLSESPQQHKMASRIIEGTRSLNQIVSNVLNYARPLELQLKHADLGSLVKKSCQWITADFNFPKNIKIYISQDETNPIVNVDEGMMRAALFNLILNAAQAMPEGGQITMKVSSKNKHSYVEIQDKGTGIQETDIEHIFEPFFTTKKDGNGLGLAEVRKIIKAHKGSIKVSSKVGEGSNFIIKLPRI